MYTAIHTYAITKLPSFSSVLLLRSAPVLRQVRLQAGPAARHLQRGQALQDGRGAGEGGGDAGAHGEAAAARVRGRD